jgi:peptidoglycan hydrolase-like protein with peptidoglycan-binding domain
MEAYNGWGYFYRGANSAYVWSWTSQYSSGKFVSDGKWSATAVDQQPGCAAMLRGLIDAGHVTIDAEAAVDVPLKIGARGLDVKKLQARLKALGYPAGTADGVYGPATRRAVILFQDEHDLTGVPGEWPAGYWPIIDAAQPITSHERAAATEHDLRAAGDKPLARITLLQRILAFFGLGGVLTGSLQNMPDTAAAITGALSPIQGLIAFVSGNLWMVVLAAVVVLLVLCRYAISTHVEAFRDGSYQGGEVTP